MARRTRTPMQRDLRTTIRFGAAHNKLITLDRISGDKVEMDLAGAMDLSIHHRYWQPLTGAQKHAVALALADLHGITEEARRRKLKQNVGVLVEAFTETTWERPELQAFLGRPAGDMVEPTSMSMRVR
jgi:hypothetical protein